MICESCLCPYQTISYHTKNQGNQTILLQSWNWQTYVPAVELQEGFGFRARLRTGSKTKRYGPKISLDAS